MISRRKPSRPSERKPASATAMRRGQNTPSWTGRRFTITSPRRRRPDHLPWRARRPRRRHHSCFGRAKASRQDRTRQTGHPRGNYVSGSGPGSAGHRDPRRRCRYPPVFGIPERSGRPRRHHLRTRSAQQPRRRLPGSHRRHREPAEHVEGNEPRLRHDSECIAGRGGPSSRISGAHPRARSRRRRSPDRRRAHDGTPAAPSRRS